MTWTGTLPTAAAGADIEGADIQTLIDMSHALTDPWTPYTPVWSGATGVSIGNGSITGGYIQVGKFGAVRGQMLFGSTTTFGSGGYQVTLPSGFAPLDSAWSGSAMLVHTTITSRRLGTVIFGSSTVMGIYSDSGPVSATVPFTWTSGMSIDWFAIMELA